MPPRLHVTNPWKAATKRIALCGGCIGLSFLAVVGFGLLQRTQAAENVLSRPQLSAAPTKIQPEHAANYGKLPLSFEANEGQTDARVRFLARGGGYTIFLTDDEAVLTLRKSSPGTSRLGKFGLPGRLEPSGPIDRRAGRWPSLADGLESLWRSLIPDLSQMVPDANAGKGEVTGGPESPPPQVMRMRLADANVRTRVVGLDELPGRSNYFIGNDPKKWRTNVPTYAKVKYKDVYPGVDLVYYGNQDGHLEYDFVVAPGADPRSIQLAVKSGTQEGSGQKAAGNEVQEAKGDPRLQSAIDNRKSSITAPLRIASDGDLVIATDADEVRLHKPVVYQASLDANQSTITNHHSLNARYVLTASNRIGFEIPVYDKTKPLVIDPTLAYSTYLGGFGAQGTGIAVDASGGAYVTGSAGSDFPTTPGAFQTTCGGGGGFVSKLNAGGSALVYSTYLCGGGPSGIAVDASGSAYVTGYTHSSDFPTTPGAFQTTLRGVTNAFVSKLNAAGSTLVYSTYLGGSSVDYGNGIAVDASGDAYVAGYTYSSDFPVTPGAFEPNPGFKYNGAFVSKLNAAGSALVYSTYLGQSVVESSASAIAVDSSGNAYVIGSASGIISAFFPTTPGAFQATCTPPPSVIAACNTAFLSKLNPAGSALVYSTFLSGAYESGIAVDASGSAYVTGSAGSDFPTTPGAFQTTCGGGGGFVSKLNAGGSALVYSTYLCGGGPSGIAVDASGNAYVTGGAYSSDFPVTPGAFQTTLAGSTNAIVSKLNAAGSALLYSTYLGGSVDAVGLGIAVDPSGGAYITGYTESPDFPITPGAFQTTFGGDENAFVSKFSFAIPFSKFDAKVELDHDRNAFDLDAVFTLGSGGSIDLSTQAVTLVIGTDSITIPPGSFVRLGAFDLFRGEINGVFVEVLIRCDRRPDQYSLRAVGRHANLTGATNPVTVTLSIGDNTGTTQFRIERGKWNRD